jgi:hypothetical protein
MHVKCEIHIDTETAHKDAHRDVLYIILHNFKLIKMVLYIKLCRRIYVEACIEWLLNQVTCDAVFKTLFYIHIKLYI